MRPTIRSTSVRSTISRAMVGGAGSATPPAAGMPEDTLGLWYASEYSTTPQAHIPNSLAAAPPANNIIAAPRRVFNVVPVWGKFGCTIVDEAVTGPDGLTEASTLVAGGNFYLVTSVSAPAGTYTVSVKVKSNSGSNEFFSVNGSPMKTATGTWQTFTHTFVAGSPVTSVYVILSHDGSTGASLQICDAAMYAGGSDLGVEPLAGHAFMNNATPSGDDLQFSDTSLSIAQFEDVISMTEATAIYFIRKTASSNNKFWGFSELQGYSGYAPWMVFSGGTLTQFAGGNQAPTASYVNSAQTNLYNKGWMAVGVRQSTTKTELFVDKSLFATLTPVSGTALMRDMGFMLNPDTNTGTGLELFMASLHDRALTDEEYYSAVDFMWEEATAAGKSKTPRTFLFAEGDSLTASTAPESYFQRYVDSLGADVPLGANWAIGGDTMEDLNDRLPYLLKVANGVDVGDKCIVSILVTNGVGTDPEYMDKLLAYVQALKAVGFLVAVATIPPRDGATDHNTNRAAYNPIIRGWVGTEIDACIDIAANTTIGDDADAANTTYYSDGTHWTTDGQTVVLSIAEPVYDALIAL